MTIHIGRRFAAARTAFWTALVSRQTNPHSHLAFAALSLTPATARGLPSTSFAVPPYFFPLRLKKK
jgi:hypothetical protein